MKELLRLSIRFATKQEIWPLRHRVLRPQQPFSAAQYPEDEHNSTLHLAAFPDEGEHAPLGVLSLYQEPVNLQGNDTMHIDSADISWRLRGMAIDLAMQRKNIGTTLLNAFYRYALTLEKPGIWCNARTSVCRYYGENGFEKVGTQFDLPNIGPHFVMVNPKPTPKKTQVIGGKVTCENLTPLTASGSRPRH